MTPTEDVDRYRIDPSKLPKQLDIDLPPAVAEQLLKHAAKSGRSVDELNFGDSGSLPAGSVTF